MDRFIDYKAVQNSIHRGNLKSNMDRFIGYIQVYLLYNFVYLKSNMDRFIDNLVNGIIVNSSTFKIQYGQIYRTGNSASTS